MIPHTHFVPSIDIQLKKTATPFGRSLGLHINNRATMINKVREGLDVSVVIHLSKTMGLTEQAVAKLALITTRTLTRRKTEGKLRIDESDRLARIAMVFDEAVDMLGGDKTKASHWFTTPKKALGGASPADYVDTEMGVQEVRNLIARIRHGVFS